MRIPSYPEDAPISLEFQDEIEGALKPLKHGISEFSFANLYLFRDNYRYRVSRLPGDMLVVFGEKSGERFVMFPQGIPADDEVLLRILESSVYIKNASECMVSDERIRLERMGLCIVEDRDNFDYLYLRKELAELEGKKFHKKRNLVKQFLNNYEYTETRIDEGNIADAFAVLDCWADDRRSRGEDEGDLKAAKEALDLKEKLGLCGFLYYVDGKPAAYVLGETNAKGRNFVVHFEKACGTYKGIYQFINKAFASMLPSRYVYINREQDLGDPGLRQAKLTYRPDSFVKKYRAYVDPTCPCPQE